MKRILWISASRIFGGAHIISNKLIERIPGSTLLVNTVNESNYKQTSYPVEFMDFNNIRKEFKSIIIFIKEFYAISFKLRKKFSNYSEIIAIDFNSLIFASIAKIFRMNIDITYYVHSAFKNTTLNKMFIATFVNMISDKIIVPSNYLKINLQSIGVKSSKIDIVYNGVEKINSLPLKRNDNSKEIIISHFGRINDQKGQDLYCRAIKQIVSEGKYDIRAYFGGEIDDKKYFEEIKREIKGYEENINYVGKLMHQDVIEIINKSDIVVCTSKYLENLPTILLEALSMGKVVVGSNLGGIPEIIENYKNGLLFEPNNEDDLYQKLKFIISEEKYTSWQQGAIESYNKKFTMDKFRSKFMEVCNI